MKTENYKYKIYTVILLLLLSLSTIAGAEYRGDVPGSLLPRFFHSLFARKSGSPTSFTHTNSISYNFAYLQQGHITTKASKNTDSSGEQTDIWSVKTTSKHHFTSKGLKTESPQQSHNYVYAIVSTRQDDHLSTALFASAMAVSLSSSKGSTGTESSASSGITSFPKPFDKVNILTYAQYEGGTDPGGDPDTPPLAIGDGFGILFLFSVLYMLLKRKQLCFHNDVALTDKKENTTQQT
ncbi:hypothetical protein [Paludibacter jiangxiensis]|uniref:Uncharacterized protein n=1 Tax=Paludibacter jiangxiensis TaxID=681398 RepID=A0A171AB12_9BACT|nr:hypothetical protein [Paludibacter jiangxiensis]GAT63468.1 hypothetical protein PJIAN_45 [Paludibacter jiangxiensis]